MLHVKAFLIEERRIVTPLIDTGSSCNILQRGYCCKHGLMIQPCKKELAGFNGAICSIAGMVEIMLAIRKWKAILPFYVLDHKAHPIIRHPELKALRLFINGVLDSFVGENGDLILCSVVRVSNNCIMYPIILKILRSTSITQLLSFDSFCILLALSVYINITLHRST